MFWRLSSIGIPRLPKNVTVCQHPGWWLLWHPGMEILRYISLLLFVVLSLASFGSVKFRSPLHPRVLFPTRLPRKTGTHGADVAKNQFRYSRNLQNNWGKLPFWTVNMTYPLETNMDVFLLTYCMCWSPQDWFKLVRSLQRVSLHLAPKYHHETSPYPKHTKNANWEGDSCFFLSG